MIGQSSSSTILYLCQECRTDVEAVLSLVVSLTVLGCAAGIGRRVIATLGSPGRSAAARLALAASVGLGCMSLAVFLLGAVQLFRSPWMHVLWVAFVAVAIPGLPGAVRDVRYALHSGLSACREPVCAVAALLLVILAVAALVPALAPPSMTDWDSLAYHLAVPRLYLQHGGIHYISFTSHSNFPFLMEMLYVPGLSIGLPIASKLTHYWTGLLLVVLVGALAGERFGYRAGLLAALGLAGIPLVLWEAGTAYVDLAAALYTAAAVYFILLYLDKPASRVAAACGIAAGLAASTKMTALAVIPLLGAWIVIHGLAAEHRPNWRGAAVAVLVAFAVCGPWYVKSIVYTGNPVYPFFYSVFGGRDWNVELANNYSALQAKFGVGRDLAAFLLAPYDLTFSSHRFYDTPGLYVGPLMLVAIPVLFVGLIRDRAAAGFACFIIAQYAVWFFLTQQSRYLIPVFALVSVLTAWTLYGGEQFRSSRNAVWVVFALTALFGFWTLVPAIRQSAPFVFGFQTREQFLTRALDTYSAQDWMNRALPADARVALFGDTRGFYLDRRYVWADYGHNAEFSIRHRSADSLAGYLTQRGITHAMVNYGFLPPRDRAQGNAALLYEAIDTGLVRRAYPPGEDAARVVVYEIR